MHLFPVIGVSPGITSVASEASEASFSCSSSKVHLFFSFSRSFSTRICSPALARAPEPGARSRRGTPRCARGDPDQLKGAAARRRGVAARRRERPRRAAAAGEAWRGQAFRRGKFYVINRYSSALNESAGCSWLQASSLLRPFRRAPAGGRSGIRTGSAQYRTEWPPPQAR